MKRLVLQDQRVEIEECEMPHAGGEWVVVRVEASTICGSDKGAFFSSDPVRTAGHEGAGEVVDAGGSSILSEGDRVVLNSLSGCGKCRLCRSGNYIYCQNKPPFESHFAEYVRIQDFMCTRLPDDISFTVGSLAACALGPAFNATKRLRVSPYDTVLITGLGPVGLGALTICRFLGAKVIGVESVPFRQEMARELGADLVLDPGNPGLASSIEKAAGSRPLLKAIDASGNPDAERLCIDSVQPTGAVAFIGENHGEIPVSPSRDFLRKGLTLLGAWHYNLNDSPELMEILRSSPIVSRLVTDEYALDDAQAAFDKFVSGNACKVLLKPHTGRTS